MKGFWRTAQAQGDTIILFCAQKHILKNQRANSVRFWRRFGYILFWIFVLTTKH